MTGWFVKAVDYIERSASSTVAELDIFAADDSGWGQGEKLREIPERLRGSSGALVGLVSTNSITQGEQVGILWGWMLAQGIKIHFAHRTFQWTNDAPGVAAVHCVIIGFGKSEPGVRRLFDYGRDLRNEPTEIRVGNINPYLLNAPDVVAEARRSPISGAPEMSFGNMPNDKGGLILSPEELSELQRTEPSFAARFVRKFWGAEEFLNGQERFCLWLVDATPENLAASSFVQERLAVVRKHRSGSDRAATNALAARPHLFGEIRQRDGAFIAVPGVSSERRRFVPIGFLDESVVVSNLMFFIPGANEYHFGVLSSTMHNAWVRIVAGRLKSDIRYSPGIVYNNFVWPGDAELESEIAAAAQTILETRSNHAGRTLAQLYSPETLPHDLSEAHRALDLLVDAAYGYSGDGEDAGRAELLFKLLTDARHREVRKL